MTDRPTIATLGELRASGLSLAERQGGDARQPGGPAAREGESLLPGIIGYDETVLPQVENAILAGQDIILLGERGQAKSRIARSLVGLLDDVDAGRRPARSCTTTRCARSAACAQALVAEQGDATPIGWVAARGSLRREAGHAGHHASPT